MNGREAGGGGKEMEEDRKEVRGAAADDEMVKEGEGRAKEKSVLMWGYLPGVSPHRSPLLYPVAVRMPDSATGDRWMDVSGGGCGFAMAISESGKLFTWGSTDDMGQSYVTSGKHEETPEVFHLPTEVPIVKAAAGWAHCVAVTANGEVYTWGWKECVPTGRIVKEQSYSGGTSEKEERHSGSLSDQVSPRLQGSRIGGVVSEFDTGCGEKNSKRRRLSSAKVEQENKSSSEETLSALPCLVTLDTGVRIASVAAGGRHTLALSDTGALLTFGWGLYGQCGQGSTNDQLSPKCVSSLLGIKIHEVAAGLWHTICTSVDGGVFSFGGNQFGQLGTGSDQAETLPKLLDAPCLENKSAKRVSCGARHTAVMTEHFIASIDTTTCGVAGDGQVFCWGWNKYGQLGLGDATDRNIPSLVPINNYQPKNVSCGWWHTLVLSESPT
ncbi:ultraviolet-B receptor UVR8-like isoform X6 [Musa acuminata AAA Group]|uniref:ultraviolet-B receptor UVR8-like isoform X6 n=1 Tax=Musa acuminata AAA Group TaxID=214697 RepID=UPI0031E3E3C4